MKKCPVCDVPVKLENLERHVKKQHPQESVDLRSILTESELKGTKAEKRRTRSRKNRSTFNISLTIIVVIVIVIIAAMFLQSGNVGPDIGSNIGQTAPDFTLQTTDNSYVALSSYRGKPFLLAFVDIDGQPCQIECAILSSVYQNYSSSVHFFSIDVDMVDPTDTIDKINSFRSIMNTPWPYALDPSRTTVNSYNISTRPCVFIIDEDGVIQRKFVGPVSNGYTSYSSALDYVLQN